MSVFNFNQETEEHLAYEARLVRVADWTRLNPEPNYADYQTHAEGYAARDAWKAAFDAAIDPQ